MQPSRWFDGVTTTPARGHMSANGYSNAWIGGAEIETVQNFGNWRSRYKRRPARSAQSPPWPFSKLFVDYSVQPQGIFGRSWFDWGNRRPWKKGVSTKFRIVGVTRDEYNTVLASAKVLFIRTDELGNPKEILDQTLSDGNGNYTVYSPYSTADHMVIAYKSGTPVIQAATIPTLTPDR